MRGAAERRGAAHSVRLQAPDAPSLCEGALFVTVRDLYITCFDPVAVDTYWCLPLPFVTFVLPFVTLLPFATCSPATVSAFCYLLLRSVTLLSLLPTSTGYCFLLPIVTFCYPVTFVTYQYQLLPFATSCYVLLPCFLMSPCYLMLRSSNTVVTLAVPHAT